MIALVVSSRSFALSSTAATSYENWKIFIEMLAIAATALEGSAIVIVDLSSDCGKSVRFTRRAVPEVVQRKISEVIEVRGG